MLEPVLLYRASKCKQTKEQAVRTVYKYIFLPFYKIIVSFFSFLCQNANKTRSNSAIISCNFSKKHELTLYENLNGESNYVDHKFFFNFCYELPVQKLGDRHANSIELASWLVHVWCYCVTLRLHDIKKLQCPLNTPWKYILLIYFTILVKSLPPSFHHSLGIFIFGSTFY